MPHDSQGKVIHEGDLVRAKVEIFPGLVWEGIAQVMRVAEDRQVCNLEMLALEIRRWTIEDTNDRSPLNDVLQMWSHFASPQLAYWVHVKTLRATASEVTLVWSGILRSMETPPGFVTQYEHDELKKKLAALQARNDEMRSMITTALSSLPAPRLQDQLR